MESEICEEKKYEKKYDAEDVTNIDLIMSRKFKNKLDFLSTDYTKSEICGFPIRRDKELIADKDGRVTIVLDDLLIPHQTAAISEVDVDANGQSELLKEYGIDIVSKITGHWHSHHTMGAFFSLTDEEMMAKYAENRNFCIFIVSSEGEHLIRMVFRNTLYGVPFEFKIEDIEYRVEPDISIKSEMDLEITQKVKVPEVVTTSYSYHSYSNKHKDDVETKKLKQDIDRRVKYLQHKNHKVMVVRLDKAYADFVKEEFAILNPIVEEAGIIKEQQQYNVIVELGEKNKAKEFMVDVKACIYKKALLEIEKEEALKEEQREVISESELENELSQEELRDYLDDEALDEIEEEKALCGSGKTSWANYQKRTDDIIRRRMNGDFISNRYDYC